MEFQVLGSLEVVDGTRPITPSAPKLREVLALLVLRYNRAVQISELVDELWGEDPPVSALSTLQTYIYKLRKILDGDRPGRQEAVLRTMPYGYVLNVPDESIDMSRFELMAEKGRAALEDDDPSRASKLLSEALAIWRGPALAGVTSGALIQAQVTRLEESRLRATELRIESDLRLGRHHALISELKELTAARSLHESLHAQLMVALHRSGRRYEALDVYRRFRSTLIEELGLEPTAALSELHQSLLSLHPSLDAPRVTVTPGAAAPAKAPGRPVKPDNLPAPAQLPADITDFTGRRHSIERAERWLVPGEEQGTGMRLIVITGMPGVGKSTLAVHVAHRIRHRFPGGQLFIRLGGTNAVPITPDIVLTGFLRATGIAPDRIPQDPAECSKLFRSWCAAQDVLIVLDDAADAAQVEPLLPGSSRCSAIVTGQAHGVPGARILPIDVMPLEDGVAFLSKLMGPERVEAEPTAAAEIVRLCGGLPLAIRVAGARLAVMPTWPLSRLASQLAESGTRLDELRLGDLDVRARHHDSYRSLGRLERAAFRLLSLLRISKFRSEEAAELLGQDNDLTEKLLSQLAERHLLRIVGGNSSESVCYAIPELTRLYALERLEDICGDRPVARLRRP